MAIAAPPNLRLPEGATAAYHIPYFAVDGNILTDGESYNTMYRRKFNLQPFARIGKYGQPSREQLEKDGLPSFLPYLLPFTYELVDGVIYCIEGEKKTASFQKYLRRGAFGIGGCNMWHDPSVNTRDRGIRIHPWILEYLKRYEVKKVIIIPDSDVFRYDMAATYGNFTAHLKNAGYEAELLNPPDKIDDFIVKKGPDLEVIRAEFDKIQPIAANDLVQSPAGLINAYGLAFKTDAKWVRTVHQHTSNVMKLMEEHNAFPRIWRNLDTNRVMVGEETATPDLTEMSIANYFQHNLGFDKVNHRIVYSCIQALSKRNARSPMLEWIQGLRWDGVPRLDTWLSRLWGCDEGAYTAEVGSKWLIAACARMAEPGCKIDWMMIVIGPQSTGKTSMPAIVFNGNSLTLYGEQNHKDLHMLMHSALVVGFDELDSFGKRESSNLKAMITSKEDAFRPPYAASVELFPRRFTLYGCGNRHEFIQHDPSGYRRYAVVEINKLLDFRGLEAERTQLWAEAWRRYSSGGEQWWEVKGASAEAEKYVVPNLLEEQIVNWVAAQTKAKHADVVKDGIMTFTMSQLMNGIGIDNSKNTNVTREIAAILRAMGATQKMMRINGQPARPYLLPIQS